MVTTMGDVAGTANQGDSVTEVRWGITADGQPIVTAFGETFTAEDARTSAAALIEAGNRADLMVAAREWLVESGCSPEQIDTALTKLSDKANHAQTRAALAGLLSIPWRS